MTAHTEQVTERLREAREEGEEHPLGLGEDEAICPKCSLAYLVAAGSWGVCSDCLGEALVRLGDELL